MNEFSSALITAEKVLAPSELYWLDLLLTGDPVHAESSMLQALPCQDRSPASFLSYIGQAVDFVRPELNASIERAHKIAAIREELVSEANGTEYDLERLARAILTIDVFPRCALVLRLAGKMTLADISTSLRVSTQLLKQALATALVTLNDKLQADSTFGIQTMAASTR